jgi:hypothetical protein
MDSKIKWLVIFQRVNDDWSVETGDVWCCAPDVEAVKAKFRNMQDATIVRIEEMETGKVVYDFEEELKKNGEKINAIYAKKYNGNFRI